MSSKPMMPRDPSMRPDRNYPGNPKTTQDVNQLVTPQYGKAKVDPTTGPHTPNYDGANASVATMNNY